MNKISRKYFLFTGLSLAAAASLFRWPTSSKPRKTIKFLTREGKLVEINADVQPTKRQAASKEDVQHWIKNK